MITIKKTKNGEIGVRITKNTDMNELYAGTGILLSVLISRNGKSVDETLELIKSVITETKGGK
jgi:hypothetical protein